MSFVTINSQDLRESDRRRPQLRRRSFISEFWRLKEIHGMVTPSSEKLVLFVVLSCVCGIFYLYLQSAAQHSEM